MRSEGWNASYIAVALDRSFSAIKARITKMNRKPRPFVPVKRIEPNYPKCSAYTIDLAEYYELGWQVAEHFPETGTCLLEWRLNRAPAYPVSHERIAA